MWPALDWIEDIEELLNDRPFFIPRDTQLLLDVLQLFCQEVPPLLLREFLLHLPADFFLHVQELQLFLEDCEGLHHPLGNAELVEIVLGIFHRCVHEPNSQVRESTSFLHTTINLCLLY